MRFTIKEIPKEWQIRTRKVFAFIPTRMNATTLIWLESYFVIEKCFYNGINGDIWWEPVTRFLKSKGSV